MPMPPPARPDIRPAVETLTLEQGQTTEAADVLCDSHADYPAFVHLIPHPDRRRTILRSLFIATVRDGQRHGTVFATTDGSRLSGVAVWLPPGAFPWSPRRKLTAVPPLLQVLARAPMRLAAFSALGRSTERAFPRQPHWYLEVLGVRRAAQGGGLGRRLLQPALARADDDRLPCYLETSDPGNVGFYQRSGFEVHGEHHLISGGPPHIAMRRRTRASREV